MQIIGQHKMTTCLTPLSGACVNQPVGYLVDGDINHALVVISGHACEQLDGIVFIQSDAIFSNEMIC